MEPTSSTAPSVRIWETMALIVSIIALIGSLCLSMMMNLKACPLCLYERTFMMGLVSVLLVGFFRSRQAEPGYSMMLCLPLAVAGLCVAAFHVNLELTGVLECPAGILGIGSAPQQSLAAFFLITALAGIAVVRSLKGAGLTITVFGTVALGIFFSIAAIKSAPPLPQPPSEPYATPLEGCRPVFSPGSPTEKETT